MGSLQENPHSGAAMAPQTLWEDHHSCTRFRMSLIVQRCRYLEQPRRQIGTTCEQSLAQLYKIPLKHRFLRVDLKMWYIPAYSRCFSGWGKWWYWIWEQPIFTHTHNITQIQSTNNAAWTQWMFVCASIPVNKGHITNWKTLQSLSIPDLRNPPLNIPTGKKKKNRKPSLNT